MNLFVMAILFFLSWQDIKTKKINVILCFITMGIIIFVNMLFGLTTINFMIVGMLIGVILLIVSFVSGNAIGVGDGITFMITGLAVGGIANFEILIISLFLSSFVGLYRLVFRTCNRKDTMAFVPYITMGYILVNYIFS